MIFVEASVEEWIKKHSQLEVIEGKCDYCGKPMKTNRPFITKGYAGLKAYDCLCGRGRNTVLSLVTTSIKKHSEWNEALERNEDVESWKSLHLD